MHVPDQLVSQVMALSDEARAELLALLQQSLPTGEAPGATASDEALAAEWTEELDRRIAKIRGGGPRGVDAKTAFAQVRNELRPGESESES